LRPVVQAVIPELLVLGGILADVERTEEHVSDA
jgi:hypothetical protein